MFCKKCGAEIKGVFCSKCGAKTSKKADKKEESYNPVYNFDDINSLKNIDNVEFDDHFYDDVSCENNDIPIDYTDSEADIRIDYNTVSKTEKSDFDDIYVTERYNKDIKISDAKEKRTGFVSDSKPEKLSLSRLRISSSDTKTDLSKKETEHINKGFFKTGGDL
ncbi:MAG: zinc ribbon domain-containing protein [Ruminococcaceae bacterium]|nr:zinc ribbon domain-containing protein [Oscillospiraceae bacterium]